ncbi:putative ribonuclease H-like domain-containing protein [Tanacetum coccineum]
MVSQRLGSDYEMLNKSCYVCGSFNHLIKNCDIYEKKMVQKPVWNNTMRVNHQNSAKMTHPHPKRNFVPTTVLNKSGKVPINTAKQNLSKAAVSVNTARPINTAFSRPPMNGAKTMSNTFNKEHSSIKRPFNKLTSKKNSNYFHRVNTVKGSGVNTTRLRSTVNTVRPKTAVNAAWPRVAVNTTRPNAVLKAVKGNMGNVVKASAYWVQVSDGLGPQKRLIFLPYVQGNPNQDLQERGIFDSCCSRHITRNKTYLTDFKETDGGFVAFGGNSRGRKITGKGKIRTGNLDFDDVYFVKELKFNLLSVSHICDKKNSVLFTDTECFVLSSDFKLADENPILLKVPRKDNMYSVDLKNIVPKRGLTCLYAKATSDESNLWHRRLGHVNFKTLNKLVKGNLVIGFPSKLFEINQTCIAYQKGKQHRASCKTKAVSLICQPLQMLHMDLFGPTFVKSLMKKTYCLVVTDDFSRFSWVFFLATKDETSGILKSFITGIKNLIDLRVKVIRSDNETEFKNRVMNKFCEMKGIRREFSVARNPQQNGVAERKNRTLIEAARTMLADSKLLTTFWAEAVNTAFYPVVAGNQTNSSAGTKATNDAGKAKVETVLGKEYILLPLWTTDPLFSSHLKNFPDDGFRPSRDDEKEDDDGNDDQEKEDDVNSTNSVNAVSTNEVNVVGAETCLELPDDPNMPPLEEIVYSDNDEEVGAEANITNLDTHIANKKDERGIMVRNKARLVVQGHTQEEGFDYAEVFAPVARIEAIMLFLAYASYMDFVVYQMDIKSAFLYGTIEEEVYVCQPLRFEDPEFPDKVYKVEKALYGLHQAPRAWYETLSTYLLENRFKRGTIDKILFIKKEKSDILLVQVSVSEAERRCTPMETNKALLKDSEDDDVDVHLYRSMIGSLMYLTASRPDIIYLKGQPKLGLWYPKDSPLDLEAYSDSDYAGASLDRNSTTGVKNPVFHSKTKHIKIRHHFLRDSYEKKLIQVMKIHTDLNVADLLTKAFDVGRFQFLIANIGMLNP